MKNLENSTKLKLNGQGNLWNQVLYTGMIGQSINSVLALINQIVYNNNPNPYYSRNTTYSNNSSRLYIRGQGSPYTSTISFGSPYF